MFRPALLLASLSLLFVGHLSVHELVAGALAWGMALLFEAVVQAAAERRFALRFPASGVWKTAASLAFDSWRVGGVIWGVIWCRPPAAVGMLRRQPCQFGDSGSRAAGRRASEIMARSLSPNEFVVDIPANGDHFCVHRLTDARGSAGPEFDI